MKTALTSIFVAFTAAVLMSGCEEKKETKVIITTRPVEVVKKDTVKMEEMKNVTDVSWNGSDYCVSVNRRADKSLAITEDEGENKYYDNRIELKILHGDGTVFFQKEFVKDDFKDFVSEEFFAKKALVGFVFEKVDGSNLKFAASIGSPDKFSDDFIPFEVVVSKSGSMSIKKSEQNLVETSVEDDAV